MASKKDDFWCADCCKSVPGMCRKHGGFHQVQDNVIPSRARLTLPSGLVVKPIKTKDGKQTFGVFAKKIVQIKSQFGPMMASITSREKHEPKTGDKSSLDEVHAESHMKGNMPEVRCDTTNIQTVNHSGHISDDHLGPLQIVENPQHLPVGPFGDSSDPQNLYFTSSSSLMDVGQSITSVAGTDYIQHTSQYNSHPLNVDLSMAANMEAAISAANAVTTSANQLTLGSMAAQLQTGLSDIEAMHSLVNSGQLNNTLQMSTAEVPMSDPLGLIAEGQSATTVDKTVEENQSKPSQHKVDPSEQEYSLKVFTGDGFALTYDITDEDKCNWMMFVRPAKSAAEQNLMVFQFEEKLYFVSTKPIPSNTELRVWYAEDYAVQMDRDLYEEEDVDETGQVVPHGTDSQAKWVCSVCLEGFNAFTKLEAHVCADGPSEEKMIRGRPRKGRPRKYVKPSKAWRSRLEKAKTKSKPDPMVPNIPKRRGRPPKLKPEAQTNVSDDPPTTIIVESGPAGSILVTQSLEEASEIPPTIDFQPSQHLLQPLQQHHLPQDHTIIMSEHEEQDHDDHGHLEMNEELPDEEDGDHEDPTTEELLNDILCVEEDGDDEEFHLAVKKRGRKKKFPKVPKVMKVRGPRREPLVCEYCDERFTKEALYVIHVSEHTGVKPFICEDPDCQKGFLSKFKLERHRLIHTCPRHHKCPYCDKSFNRKDHLKNHLITHDPNKKRWVCEECGKEYSYNFSYRTHKAFHDADAGRTTDCGICRKPHNSRDELLYHLKVHSGARSIKNCTEKTHGCSECGKKFYTKKDVRRHMITHTKNKDFLCQFCPQRFGRKDHLTRHLRASHSGDNPVNGKPPRAPRSDRKEKFKQYEAITLPIQIPRDDLLGQSQLNNPYQIHNLQTDGREFSLPIQLYENIGNQQPPVITMTTIPPQTVHQHLQHNQTPQLQQQLVDNEMQIERFTVEVTNQVMRQQQNIDSPTPTNLNDFRHIQTQGGTMYIAQPQQQQQVQQVQQQQMPQQHVQQVQLQQQLQQTQQQLQQQQQLAALVKQDPNLELIRSNGVLPQADYQQTITQVSRPTVLQNAENRQQPQQQAQQTQQQQVQQQQSQQTNQQGTPQTFSTLLGYMETLRFLENLPTNAQGSVIQMDVTSGHPTMIPVPIQTTQYVTSSTPNMIPQQQQQQQQQLVTTTNDMNKRLALPLATPQTPQAAQLQTTYQQSTG